MEGIFKDKHDSGTPQAIANDKLLTTSKKINNVLTYKSQKKWAAPDTLPSICIRMLGDESVVLMHLIIDIFFSTVRLENYYYFFFSLLKANLCDLD